MLDFRTMFRKIILLLGFICIAINLSAQDDEANSDELFSVIDTSKELLKFNIQQLDEYFTGKYESGKFNGNVLIAQKGKPIFSKSYGYAIKETWEKLSIHSSFQLASTSKPFTAAALLILVDRGKINLDDTLQVYFPDFPYSNITVRMLLCHRTGLPDYLIFSEKYWNSQKYMDNWDVYYMMECNKPKILAAPNTTFDYNNTNYVILAALVEKVSGLSFDKYLEKNIFKPLGMNHTWVWHPEDSRKKSQTYGYSYSWKRRVPDMYDGVWGDKGIYSTVEDLLKWDQSWYTNIILSPKSIKEAYKNNNVTSSRKNYGLGWRTYSTDEGSKIIYHNGWWHDYNIVFKRYLKDTTTIIIFSNKYNQSVYKTDPVLAILNNKKLPIKDTMPAVILYDTSSIKLQLSVKADSIKRAADSIFLIDQKKDLTKVSSNQTTIKKDSNTIVKNTPSNSTPKPAPPKPPVPKKPTYPITHIIKKGDTLYSLAKKYDCTVEEIKKWNKLTAPDIKIGGKLIIKKPGSK